MIKFSQVAVLLLLAASCWMAAEAALMPPGMGNQQGGYGAETMVSAGDTWRVRRVVAASVDTATKTAAMTAVRVARAADKGVNLDGHRFVIRVAENFAFAHMYFTASTDAQKGSTAGNFGVDTARAAFAFRLQELLMYRETNSVEGYQEGADTIVGQFNLNNFGTPVVSESQLTTTNTMRIATIATSDNVFGVRVFACNEPAYINGNAINPDGLKLSFMFNASAAGVTDPAVKFALRGVMISATTRTQTQAMEQLECNNATDPIAKRMRFAWANKVNSTVGATRVEAKVHTAYAMTYQNATLLSGFDQAKYTMSRLTWSFGTDKDISGAVLEWDPATQVDVDYDALDATVYPPSGATSFVPSGALFLFSLVALMVGVAMW